jgi:tol-pal system protein YbgF
MKLSHFILLTACAGASTAYAGLPPVLDSSVAYRTALIQPAIATDAATNQLITRLDQLQASIAAMQTKIDQNTIAINGLGQVQNVVNSNVATVNAKVESVKAKQEIKSTTATPVAIKAPAVLGSEQQRYQSAYATFRAGNVDLAMVEFQNIIRDFPKGSLADNAQYWLGEAYLLKGKKTEAMQAFDKVVLAYPKSNKVPDALLKLGFVQLGLNNRAKAKEYLDYVILNYPKSNAAKLAILKATQASL